MNLRARLRGLHGLVRPRPDDREGIETYQSACLRHLVQHAYSSIPYYRRVFDDAGVKPSDVQTVADVGLLPVTSREPLQQLGSADLCPPGIAMHTLRTVHTSGSGGTPLVVRRSMFEERLLLAFRARAVGAYGFGLRSRRANIDHLSPDVVAVEGGELLYERLGIMPRLQLDWREPPSRIIDAIDRFQPHLLSGPPSILSWISGELSDSDRERISATLTITGGENLTPEMKRDVEAGFGVPVADVYGSHEVVFIAMQVPGSERYRICEEAVIVEVLRDGVPAAPGESGEVVVTALHSFVQPFIRYSLGDHVTVGGPLTGKHGPYSTLTSIDGRTLDKFVLPDGRELLGYSLGEVLETSGLMLRRFRITQYERDAFKVELALYASGAAEIPSVERRMRAILGNGVRLHVEVLPTLGQTSRKFYPFIPFERLATWGQAGPR